MGNEHTGLKQEHTWRSEEQQRDHWDIKWNWQGGEQQEMLSETIEAELLRSFLALEMESYPNQEAAEKF